MYEESIPAIAYIFIGVTSLVITYTHLTQNKNEEVGNETVNEEQTQSDPQPESEVQPSTQDSSEEQSSSPTIETAPQDNKTKLWSVPAAQLVAFSPLNPCICKG